MEVRLAIPGEAKRKITKPISQTVLASEKELILLVSNEVLMCLLALFYRMVSDAPLLVGANREEYYSRPGTPPQIIEGPARAVAGLDTVAGGTWLGVNERSMLVAVTNRLKSQVVPNPRSRGLLAREMLGCKSTKEAIALATAELDANRYAGCNIVCGDGNGLTVFQSGDWLRIKPLPPGLHLLTNHDINDASDPRLGFALNWLYQHPYETAENCVTALKQLCGLNGSDGQPPICLHGKEKGTVSSTLVVLAKSLRKSIYLHSDGPPDRVPYQDYSHLIRAMR